MAKITEFKGYGPPAGDPRYNVPRPSELPDPIIVTVQDGVPVTYPGCAGVGVRVVHPANPKAPAKNLGLVLFYIPPHVTLMPAGHHPTEETYVVLEGEATMHFERSTRQVKRGDFIYLPPWTLHGIENTGTEMCVVLICTSPPNP
jgi:mannose-6-phosphate isomerase-like protein (cupin superfamily)